MSADILTPFGLRQDGRRLDQSRRIVLSMGRLLSDYTPLNASDFGAASIEIGETRVLAQVVDALGKSRHFLECELNVALMAVPERRSRPMSERQTNAIQQVVQRTFEEVIRPAGLKGRLIAQVTVLSADGGVLAAAINCVTLALVRAGIPMTDLVTAASFSQISGKVVVDPTASELSMLQNNLTFAMHDRGQKLSVACSETKCTVDELQRVLAAATVQCKDVAIQMQRIMTEHLNRLAICSQLVSSRIISAGRKDADNANDGEDVLAS